MPVIIGIISEKSLIVKKTENSLCTICYITYAIFY